MLLRVLERGEQWNPLLGAGEPCWFIYISWGVFEEIIVRLDIEIFPAQQVC